MRSKIKKLIFGLISNNNCSLIIRVFITIEYNHGKESIIHKEHTLKKTWKMRPPGSRQSLFIRNISPTEALIFVLTATGYGLGSDDSWFTALTKTSI